MERAEPFKKCIGKKYFSLVVQVGSNFSLHLPEGFPASSMG